MTGSVRVYLPTTLVGLGRLRHDGRVGVEQATAVTEDLRAALPDLDEEELELEALLDAADLSLAVASVHVDEPAAEPRIAAGDVEGVDLLWYAPQELTDILGG